MRLWAPVRSNEYSKETRLLSPLGELGFQIALIPNGLYGFGLKHYAP